jgi:hypothetical protein
MMATFALAAEAQLPPETLAAVMLKGQAPALAQQWAQMAQPAEALMAKLPSRGTATLRAHQVLKTLKLLVRRPWALTARAQMMLSARAQWTLRSPTRARLAVSAELSILWCSPLLPCPASRNQSTRHWRPPGESRACARASRQRRWAPPLPA